MTAGETQPTQPLPEWATAAPEPRRRGRVWPWVVALLIVAALAVGAWFAGEAIARGIVTSTIRDQVITQLSLPADQQVDVAVEGTVIPQLLSGSLDDVTVSSEDVPIGRLSDNPALASLSGDVAVHATGIPIRGDAPVGSVSATILLDTAQLRTLLSTVEGLPADSVGLAEPDVTMTTELSLFGIGIPIGIALTPSAVDGDLVLTPASLQLGGNAITAEDLQAQFGGIADSVLRGWTVCIAEFIPAGAELSSVAVADDQVVAEVDIDGAIVTDPALRATGVCD